MTGGIALLLLTLLAPAPVCGREAGEPARRAVLVEVNLARLAAGRSIVAPHPALCALARGRASEIAFRGSTQTTAATLNDMTRRIYGRGYAPHHWTESTLIGVRGRLVLEQLASVRPTWAARAANGDFEHVGIGMRMREGRPVYSIVLGLSKRTVERRRVAPLKDLATVRAAMLAAVNAARREHGRRPVSAAPELDVAAQRHAEDMARRAYYDHRSLDGKSPAQRARRAGHRGARVVAENIAKGLFTPSEVVSRWLNSSGHRRNILDRGADVTGAGVAFAEGDDGFEVLWVQMFAGQF